MDKDQQKITAAFGNRLRVRVCGICIEENKLLMIRHRSLGNGYLWAPPGGGLEYGETLENALKREFVEETGLEIRVKQFLFVHEYLQKPLHGIELFFEVIPIGGKLARGNDPEMKTEDQIIDKLKYLTFEDIRAEPSGCVHHALSYANNIAALLEMRGMYHFV
jgi:8-oxo-dGTP diphosphatase